MNDPFDFSTTLSDIQAWKADLEALPERIAAMGPAPSAHQVAEVVEEAEKAPELPPMPDNPFIQGGDPTPEQLMRMSPQMVQQLEAAKPGTVERVEQSQEWLREANRQAKHLAEAEANAEYQRKLNTDPAFNAQEQRKNAEKRLRENYNFLSQAQIDELRVESGASDELIQELENEMQLHNAYYQRRPL